MNHRHGTPRARHGWAFFCLVVFVLFNSCAGHREFRAVGAVLLSGSWRWTPGNTLRALRAYGTDDGDALRYFAYSNAVLGRPYQGYYVRPAAEWLRHFAATRRTAQTEDADDLPLRVPGAPLVPYRDFLVEYPPGFFLFTLPWATLVAGDGDRYLLLFSCAMGLLLLCALLLCVHMARLLPGGEGAAGGLPAWTAASLLLLGVVAVRRYDPAVSASLCLLCSCCLSRQPVLAGIGLGMAVAAKLVPVLVAPVVVMYLWHAGRRREITYLVGAAAIFCLVLCLPLCLLAGPHLADVLRYHQQRPLQVESTAAALLGLYRIVDPGAAQMVYTFGSFNVSGSLVPLLSAVSTAVTVLGILAVYAHSLLRLRRAAGTGQRDLALLSGVAGVLVVFMVCGKVFSPQYLVWLLPLLVLLALVDGGRTAPCLLLGVMLLTQLIFPVCTDLQAMQHLSPWACALVLSRNMLLLCLWLVAQGRGPSADRLAPSGLCAARFHPQPPQALQDAGGR